MSDCLFCKIIAGDIPAEKIYEDDDYLVFMDIQPVNAGHALVVPKKHRNCTAQMPDEEVASLFATANRIAKQIRKALSADGYNLAVNNGEAAGQVIFHTHVHIIPRFENDGHKAWSKKNMTNEDIKEVAEKIINFN